MKNIISLPRPTVFFDEVVFTVCVPLFTSCHFRMFGHHEGQKKGMRVKKKLNMIRGYAQTFSRPEFVIQSCILMSTNMFSGMGNRIGAILKPSDNWVGGLLFNRVAKFANFFISFAINMIETSFWCHCLF